MNIDLNKILTDALTAAVTEAVKPLEERIAKLEGINGVLVTRVAQLEELNGFALEDLIERKAREEIAKQLGATLDDLVGSRIEDWMGNEDLHDYLDGERLMRDVDLTEQVQEAVKNCLLTAKITL